MFWEIKINRCQYSVHPHDSPLSWECSFIQWPERSSCTCVLWTSISCFDQSSLANCVFNLRKVAFLMEGARACITYHQTVLSFAFTDPALVIISLILLRMKHMFWMIVVQAGQGGMHKNTHQFISIWLALHTVTHERVDHQDFSLKETDLQIHTSILWLALFILAIRNWIFSWYR